MLSRARVRDLDRCQALDPPSLAARAMADKRAAHQVGEIAAPLKRRSITHSRRVGLMVREGLFLGCFLEGIGPGFAVRNPAPLERCYQRKVTPAVARQKSKLPTAMSNSLSSSGSTSAR